MLPPTRAAAATGVDPFDEVHANFYAGSADYLPQTMVEMLLYRQVVNSGLQTMDPAEATVVFFNPMNILSSAMDCK